MITDERLSAFLHSFDLPLSPQLEQIREKALKEGVPVIRQEMISFLSVFLELKHPGRILEVGTAAGFSALMMAEMTGGECHITTIENYQPRIAQARKNFDSHPLGKKITLIEGDAADVLGSMEEEFDFIFMDAAKGQYIRFLPDAVRLLSSGGVLISDNVLQEGDILESHYIVERRKRTIYHRMREYLLTLKQHPLLVTSIVPIGDGAAVSVKRDGGPGETGDVSLSPAIKQKGFLCYGG